MAERSDAPLRVRHAWLVCAAPRSLFTRVEDPGAYGWALFTLLGLVTLTGYARVQTGLIDRVVDEQTESSLAALENEQGAITERVRLRDRMDAVRKTGEFNKLLARLFAVVMTPVYLLASFLLIASVLYALVALTGRKPEYHTLMSICVYSGFILLIGYVVHLSMIVHYRTTEVDTSLAALASLGTSAPTTEPASATDVASPDVATAAAPATRLRVATAILGAIDPFRVWFWVCVAIGLTTTRQLSRRMAVACCIVMPLIAAAVRATIPLVI
ncbi:MAG: YIP1 family protein [Phycisphaerae bacterium]